MFGSEVEEPTDWSVETNLSINVAKAVEMVVDFRRSARVTSLFIGGETVKQATTLKYLGLHLSGDLIWSSNTASIIRRAHQSLCFNTYRMLLPVCGGECLHVLHHGPVWELLWG